MAEENQIRLIDNEIRVNTWYLEHYLLLMLVLTLIFEREKKYFWEKKKKTSTNFENFGKKKSGQNENGGQLRAYMGWNKG